VSPDDDDGRPGSDREPDRQPNRASSREVDRELGHELDRELDRVAGRLRTLGPARLERPGADGRSPAALAHQVAQALADLAADAAGRGRRAVPVLPAHAVADQVTVTAHDLLAEGDEDAMRAGLQRLVALRRSL
jgi:hypothetical protein